LEKAPEIFSGKTPEQQEVEALRRAKEHLTHIVSYEFYRYFIALIFVVISFVHAQNLCVDKAKNLLNILYGSTVLSDDKILDYGNKAVTSKYFSSDMVDLLYLDHKCQIEHGGEACWITWDFLCDCQDMTDKFSVTFETKSTKPVQILAKITDVGKTSELQFNFIVEKGMIRISDIIKNGKYSLKEALLSPLE